MEQSKLIEQLLDEKRGLAVANIELKDQVNMFELRQ